ncbi:MAG TPA: CheR family methyltransferase [Ignavibacteriales bacterium]|nr:CheR family methyltransferase [Ignavibacteriales bacterium]
MHLNDLLKYINDFLGIYYPVERAHELERIINLAARESNFRKTDEFVDFLFSVPQSERINLLAKYLTIGETYFFREIATFEALKPEIINFVNKNGRLDIWSAGCCTGEEPYSIAIMLKELFPERHLRLNITATDINYDFLKRASEGLFSNWSFRGVSDSLKKKYFFAEGNKFRISDEIKAMVSFSFLNLAGGSYHLPHHTGKFDIIFCRNVLMYFSEDLRIKAVNGFYELLYEGGFLALGLAEISSNYTRQFARINFENTVLFQKKKILIKHASSAGEVSFRKSEKSKKEEETKPGKSKKSGTPEINPIHLKSEKKADGKTLLSESVPSEEARYLFESGEYEKAINILLSTLSIPPEAGHSLGKRAEAFEILIRALTSAGDTDLAIDWCRKGIEENKLSARFYILLANLLNLAGDITGAIEELKKAVFLEPENFIANFYLANVYRKNNETELARRHLKQALNILGTFDPEEVLAETEGITAGRMKEVVERQLRTISNK